MCGGGLGIVVVLSSFYSRACSNCRRTEQAFRRSIFKRDVLHKIEKGKFSINREIHVCKETSKTNASAGLSMGAFYLW